MIYPASVDSHSASKLQTMNFNLLPGLRRPTDFSVSSILGNSGNSSPPTNMWTGSAPAPRLPPGLSALHNKLPDMLAAEMMMSQHHLALRNMENTQESTDTNDDAQVELEGMDLWEKFHEIGTEMVITKCGRFVFIISYYQCFYKGV